MKFFARRDIVKKRSDFERSSPVARNRGGVENFPTVCADLRADLSQRSAELQMRNRADRRKRLAPKSHRRELEEIFVGRDFRSRMSLQRKECIFSVHPHAVVIDPDELESSLQATDLDPRSVGIEAVFDQLFDDRGGIFNYFSRSDRVDHIFWETTDFCFHKSIILRYTSSMRVLFFLVWAPTLFASYIGNPSDPAIMDTGIFSLRNPLLKGTTGYIWDYVSNKYYVPTSGDGPPLDQFSIHTQSASLSFIFLERIEVLGTVGGSKQSAVPVPFHGAYQLSWSTGVKVVLLQWGKTCFCTGFDYFAIPASPKSFFKYLERVNMPITLDPQPAELTEWQITAGLASRFFIFTPYAGAVYLRSKLHLDVGSIDYHNKNRWGFFYGMTMSITGRLHLNFEGRLRDEKAFSFGTTAVF